jgi:hypothetical protein
MGLSAEAVYMNKRWWSVALAYPSGDCIRLTIVAYTANASPKVVKSFVPGTIGNGQNYPWHPCCFKYDTQIGNVLSWSSCRSVAVFFSATNRGNWDNKVLFHNSMFVGSLLHATLSVLNYRVYSLWHKNYKTHME